jgi:hypothetical protein
MPNVKQGVHHTLALPFTLKSIFKGKRKNYENSNISPCKNIIFKKTNPLKETKILQQLKPKYHVSKILI